MPPTLHELLLQHQNITDIRLGDFHGLTSLIDLRIQDSHVVNLQPGCFESLPRVKDLDLRRNSIRRLEAETFKGLEQLGRINLDDNKIYHIANTAFARLIKLRSMSIKNNCLSSIPQGTESIRTMLLTNNPITSVTNIGDFKHVKGLDLIHNKIRCDCRVREIKKFILENNKKFLWKIPCVDHKTGTSRLIEDVRWDDLTCASPDVSIITDNGTVTGNVSFTCQTDCQEGLKFSWIPPNGDHRSSSYEFSKNYTHVSKLLCKGSNASRLETKRMCYSVLNILPMGNGTYTCKVTADHTQNGTASAVYQDVTARQDNMAQSDDITTKPNERSTRQYNPQDPTAVQDNMVPVDDIAIKKDTPNLPPTRLLSTTELIIAGLGQMVPRESHYQNGNQFSNTVGHTGDAHYENDNQFSDRVAAIDGHYENDNQFSDGTGAIDGNYENDNQFSDAGAARDGHYGNENQFSDGGGARDGHNENDNQFSDGTGAIDGHYENENQFSDVGATRDGHYENDEQFSDPGGARDGHNENDNQFSDEEGARDGHYENENQFSDGEGARDGHYENDNQFSDGGGARDGHYGNDNQFLNEGARDGQYENDDQFLNAGGARDGHFENDNQFSDSGGAGEHYDNEKKTKDFSASVSDDTGEDDTDPKYMTFPKASTENETGAGDLQSEGENTDKDFVSGSVSDANMPDHDYVTFPVTEDAEDQDIQTEHCNEKEPDLFNEDDSLHHTYVTFPDLVDQGKCSSGDLNLRLGHPIHRVLVWWKKQFSPAQEQYMTNDLELGSEKPNKVELNHTKAPDLPTLVVGVTSLVCVLMLAVYSSLVRKQPDDTKAPPAPVNNMAAGLVVNNNVNQNAQNGLPTNHAQGDDQEGSSNDPNATIDFCMQETRPDRIVPETESESQACGHIYLNAEDYNDDDMKEPYSATQ
uniref:Ig-like domain-containing protein n=1 Tax=Branchiostoma floridae TaxID=7739 RepID=C3ZHB5_BRAFL|eukprot:XP_002592087.1 hypothetical protein BRAFLDRAFT_104744 [Branchiostoma floridae]